MALLTANCLLARVAHTTVYKDANCTYYAPSTYTLCICICSQRQLSILLPVQEIIRMPTNELSKYMISPLLHEDEVFVCLSSFGLFPFIDLTAERISSIAANNHQHVFSLVSHYVSLHFSPSIHVETINERQSFRPPVAPV